MVAFLLACCKEQQTPIRLSPPCPECYVAEKDGLIFSYSIVDSVHILRSDSVLAGYFFSLEKFPAYVSKGQLISFISYNEDGSVFSAQHLDMCGRNFYKYDTLGFVKAAAVKSLYADNKWWMKTRIDSSNHTALTTYHIEMNNEFDLQSYYNKDWRMDSADVIDYALKDPAPMYRAKYSYEEGKLVQRAISLPKPKQDSSNAKPVQFYVPWYWKLGDTTQYDYAGNRLIKIDRRITYMPKIGVVRIISLFDANELCRWMFVINKHSFIRYEITNQSLKSEAKGFWAIWRSWGKYVIPVLTVALVIFAFVRTVKR